MVDPLIHLIHLEREGRDQTAMSLSKLAEKWRSADEASVVFSRDPSLRTGSVDQVDQNAEINDLVAFSVDQSSGSGGSPPEVSGELTSWLKERAEQNAWGFTPDQPRESLDRLRQGAEQVQPALEVPILPGVSPEWTAGVYKLQTMPAPCGIDPFRWERFRHDALRLLHEQGAELHAAGWDALELFGL